MYVCKQLLCIQYIATQLVNTKLSHDEGNRLLTMSWIHQQFASSTLIHSRHLFLLISYQTNFKEQSQISNSHNKT